jgi:hypothetical protein
MPACNTERFLRRAIESVLQQTFRDFEFVVVDFGSTDNSRSIISHYAASDSRVRPHLIPNCSLPVARNAGCFAARGRYIAVMDADDVCLPDRLKSEVEFLENHPEIGLLGGAVVIVDGSDQEFISYAHPREDHDIRLAQHDHCAFWHPTVLLRKDAFVTVGGYRGAFVFSHDYDLELRVSEKFGCANLDEVVLKYRVHAGQVSLRKQRQQTLCQLAAQAAARIRRNGQHDTLDTVTEITPALLLELGVSPSEQQTKLVSDCQRWLSILALVGQPSVALQVAIDLSHSDLRQVDTRHIADFYLTIARLYWRQGKFWRGGLAVGRAATFQPQVMRPLLKRGLQKLGVPLSL